MTTHYTFQVCRRCIAILILLLTSFQTILAQSITEKDITETLDFDKEEVSYSLPSGSIPEGSECVWKIDGKDITTGLTDEGKTITLSLYNQVRKAVVTIKSSENTETIEFDINPKTYGEDYDGKHFYADCFHPYNDGTQGDGTKDRPFLISNDKELALLARKVTSGTLYSGKYFRLTSDIDLSKGLWMPIGKWNPEKNYFFAGKFDGDGHAIRNMQICWTNANGKEASWGLFSRLSGTAANEAGFASVTNLIIDNATIEKKKEYKPVGTGTVKLGILAADLTKNAEISNIIIRQSKITDNAESYQANGVYRIGGIVGYIGSGVFRIYNISSATEINMLSKATVKKSVTISGGIGCATTFTTNNSYNICPTNIYVHGPKPVANSEKAIGSVIAFYGPSYQNSFPAEAKKTLYYTSVNKVTGTNNDGTEKEVASFGKEFIDICNQYINDKGLDNKTLAFNTTTNSFSFNTAKLILERGKRDTLTVYSADGNPSSEGYIWYVSNGNSSASMVSKIPSSSYFLPRKDYDQYVYATLPDGSSRTNTVVVKAIRMTATLDSRSNPGTYSIHVTNNTEEGFSNDDLGLTIKYQWFDGTTKLNNSTPSFTRPAGATHNNRYSCLVTVITEPKDTLLSQWLSAASVVYLKPTDTQSISESERKSNAEWGYSPEKPMLTWEGAYSKLSPNGSWDENFIVLIGTSKYSVINNISTGFNITPNYQGENMLKLGNWKEATSSALFRNVTITGKWENNDYKGIIEISGATKGLPIWGDTRFEHLTFHNASGSADYYKNIYCQYHNLEMGDSLRMTGFNQNSPEYGTIDGAVTTAMQIFGGFNNDGRFYPFDNEKNIKAFEESIPHGKEGFSITVKSGFYSAICAGGRQTAKNGNSDDNTYNGVMGTPHLPIKCTITVDIDRKWNDANNPLRKVFFDKTGTTEERQSDYDAGIILAGNHEGAMYADVDIIVRSGKVARIVNGTLGNDRDLTFNYPKGSQNVIHVPCNTFMGRANITLDPEKSENNTDRDINNRVIVTELYGGSTGRGHLASVKVNNPFYGYSTITINGGTFKILPEDNKKKENILCGIFGAGAGGMNGIGTDSHHTADEKIPYWSDTERVMLYGPYDKAKGKLITYRCYNALTHTYTEVDPTKTNTKIVINGGVYGSEGENIDGIYAGGSGYMSKSLWTYNATPSITGGNVYGGKDITVSSLTINGGIFHCKNGIFAGGRGTDYYYKTNKYGGNATDYTHLGQTFGNVELNIYGGEFHCSVFGGGYGVGFVDTEIKTGASPTTLTEMAKVSGQSKVNIHAGTFFGNIYGGGDMAVVEHTVKGEYATDVRISDNADIRGSVFAGGNGRCNKEKPKNADSNWKPEDIGKITGNTNMTFLGDSRQAPYIYGDIYGGGNYAQVEGNTSINLYAANFAGEIFGGGKGDITSSPITSADVKGNTYVNLAQDMGDENDDNNSKNTDHFSINVIWNKMWRWDDEASMTKGKFYLWDKEAAGNGNIEWNPDGITGTDSDTKDAYEVRKDLFYGKEKPTDNAHFIYPHNIFGGGNVACSVRDTAKVCVQKGMTPYSLLKTDEWKASYNDNENPHFYVFGGGKGINTTVGNTDVTVNVEGDYSIYDAEVDDNTEQMARPHLFNITDITSANDSFASIDDDESIALQSDKQNTIPVFDNSKGIPNFTVLGVLGGGYAGLVTHNTRVTVDGQTFLHRIYGGGFGDPASTEDNPTGQVEGNTEVFIKGARTYGDVFGGGAGVKSSNSVDFINVARVNGTTRVEVSDNARIFGNVYGGGDIANIGLENHTPDYAKEAISASKINQTDGTFVSYHADNYSTWVNIVGGDIFGNVFGGGKGLTAGNASDYTEVGRINGNTLVHIANTDAPANASLDSNGNNIPNIWSSIYGGCAYGTVDGNAMVHIEGGLLGMDVFGGGYGNVPVITDESSNDDAETYIKRQILGKKYEGESRNDLTFANILGNTKVRIDGGTWIWNRKADSNGIITTWTETEADSRPICDNIDEYKQIVNAIQSASSLKEIDDQKVKEAINRIKNDETTKQFFDFDRQIFKLSHNIFGGGNRAGDVGTYKSTTATSGTGSSVVIVNHSPLADLEDTKGRTISMFDCTRLQSLCWFISSENTSDPQFSVFGAGYGANTKVARTEVYAQPGSKIDNDGLVTINDTTYRYRNQASDLQTYSKFEESMEKDFSMISNEEKKLYYGSADGNDINADKNDSETFLRYHASRWAWNPGMSGFTFQVIHGGGYSGYVSGNTYVETDCQLNCRDIYGAGLGALPFGSYTDGKAYDFGTVSGNSRIFMKAGIISQNVYGGGAGIESASNNGTFTDFPNMARVNKTEVHIYGRNLQYKKNYMIYRTIVFGSIYGGGDVANVGTKEAAPSKFGIGNYTNPQDRTTLVNIRGGAVLSQVFAGGRGRLSTLCNNHKQLGGVYGNTCLVIDRPNMIYPYMENGKPLSPESEENMKHPADNINKDIIPIFMERIYGGCENGTVYGNTLMTVYDGYIGHGIYGGGLGCCDTVSVDGKDSMMVTSADVTGNTNVFICGGKALLASYWLADNRAWYPASIINGTTYSPQYDHNALKFRINHNIYAGGNVACTVGHNTYLTLKKGLLHKDTHVVSGQNGNFFETNEWKEIYNKVGSPHFCIFGGGFGENTYVKGDTHVNVSMEERGSIKDLNIEKGKEYKHFIGDYAIMDIVGGGYSGTVCGTTHIEGPGGAFCRRVFGGGFYSSVDSTDVRIKVIDCHDIFGGGLMGNVLKGTNVVIGSKSDASAKLSNADINIHNGVYGGNDVSGYVNIVLDEKGYFKDNGGSGTNISILGGHIYGNVYGAGNGNYLYALDKKGNDKVTVNEHYPLNPDDPNSETVPLVYTVPMRETMPSFLAASDAAKIVNINSWRPLTNKVNITIEGNTPDDGATIDGDVYGGGNSASVQKVKNSKTDADPMVGNISINIGNHVRIGRVFMGCNGDEMFASSEDNDFMNKFRKLNGSVYNYRKELNFADSIDWTGDPSNKSISTLYLTIKNENRHTVYPHLIDLYFQSVETNIQGKLTWNGNETGEGLKDCIIGTFCCGGNRGNMNVYPMTEDDYPAGTPKEDMKIGNAVEYTFPEGLVIKEKIVGGCYNANYNYKDSVTHNGGYLLGMAHAPYPFIKLIVKNQFDPLVDSTENAYKGGNVYGGCYKSGTIQGDVSIILESDMLNGKTRKMLENSNKLASTKPEYSALNVYGAGYGMESYVYGITNIKMAENMSCSNPANEEAVFSPTGASANFIYGGGQQGNVIGVTNVEIFNGHVFRSVTGGSYAGYVWGSTMVKVGYPKYYKTLKTGRYFLTRTDQSNKDIDKGKDVTTETIKQSVHLLEDDLVSQSVYEAITSVWDKSSDSGIDISTDEKKADYFTAVEASAPAIGWGNININIGEAVYGGGYSLAQGSSVMADNTTVLKFTDKCNVDKTFTASPAYINELNNLPGHSTVGFGGNTTILIADRTKAPASASDSDPDRDHITISHQQMKEAQLSEGQDLLGYYYKGADGEYHYIYEAGKYQKDGNLPTNISSDDKKIYMYDNEGGIFGDGHLSYAQGFRCADLTGYGFASSSIGSPKIINTFQRMDILRLTDNCFALLGARDYATNAMDKTPYSISRVGEIQMKACDIVTNEDGSLKSGDNDNHYDKRARNYMGLSNNIHYVGALHSNVDFHTEIWHDGNGKPSADGSVAGSYMAVKQKYIDDYFNDGENKGKNHIFEKRNDGTAKNMIGIASGYALKIQNIQEWKDNGTAKQQLYYGPIYGVVEMNLIDVREDEGGGYVYADNIHKRPAYDEDSKAVDFLETTGNFVFPYSPKQGRYIVDDCFPVGYTSIHENGSVRNPDEAMPAHYWYVTGFNYHYNAHITGFSYNLPYTFNSDNQDGIVSLAGLKPSQEVKILSWKTYSAHKEGYSCDLEERNYCKDSLDAAGNHVMGKYQLFVGAANSQTYVKPLSKDEQQPSDPMDLPGFAAQLDMKHDANANSYNILQFTLPKNLPDGDARIVFQLSDSTDNSSTDYYNAHLSEPCKATLVLTAPAMQYKDGTDGEIEPVISMVSVNNRLFTRDSNGTFIKVENENLAEGTKYFYKNGETDLYQEISDTCKFYKKKNDTEGYEVTEKSDVQPNSSTTYYCILPRHYTYTVDLTIEYIQGPDIDGGITIENCALPGEMIRVNKNDVNIKADEAFAVTGYYWRIGKRKMKDGKWTFEDKTPWSKNDSSASGYDSYKEGSDVMKGMFAGCHYDKTEAYLDIPAYYYMNGYGIQLGVTMNVPGLNDILPVSMHDADTLTVHNYQRMHPGMENVNLHLEKAMARASHDAAFARPRIYISDLTDLNAFTQFVDTIGSTDESIKNGANAEFCFTDDITVPAGFSGVKGAFHGILHGNGHVIHGIGTDRSLFGTNLGSIYNLGLSSGKIAANGSAPDGAYHCCFEYAPDSASPVHKVYDMDGKVKSDYSDDDFRYGRVAYDLNGYYLCARKAIRSNADHKLNDTDRKALAYVFDYYANGDFQYAHRNDSITGRNSGITFLRTGKDSNLPNYGNASTRHDKTHSIDIARATYKKGADGKPLFSGYQPLIGEGLTDMNDFIFWGQSLQDVPADWATEIASHQNCFMANRVYRTEAYYGSTKVDYFHYNAYSQGTKYMDTYVHIPTTTAIDFSADDDNAAVFHAFTVKDGVSQNLLVYTNADSNDTDNAYSACTIVDNALKYEEGTPEALISGHHVTVDNGTATAPLLHLVERTSDGTDSEGEICLNNDFCVPKAFHVTKRAWYTRKPNAYSISANDAWEGICLPFTVDKAVASLNREITHFYGSAPEGTPASENHWNLHHEYWLRGMVAVGHSSADAKRTEASFLRPGNGLFSDATADGKGVDYTFSNSFFRDTYGNKSYNYSDNSYYAQEHHWNDYLPLTAGVPYIISLPGERYYEFDLSSKFYNARTNSNEPAQTVTFNAYASDSSPVSILVTGDMKSTAGSYNHIGTFLSKATSQGSVYAIDHEGTSFKDAEAKIMPFRTYMQRAAAGAKEAAPAPSVIHIAQTRSIEAITPEVSEQQTENLPDGSYITVTAIGKQRVRIESTRTATLRVFTPAGQLYRLLDIRPGTASYSGFQPGLYLFGGMKVRVW